MRTPIYQCVAFNRNPLSAMPVASIAAARAARSIVRATIRGTGGKILSVPADGFARLNGLFPSLTDELLSFANRMLPSPRSDGSRQTRIGYDIEAQFNSRLWKTATSRGQRAAEDLNKIKENPVNAVSER